MGTGTALAPSWMNAAEAYSTRCRSAHVNKGITTMANTAPPWIVIETPHTAYPGG